AIGAEVRHVDALAGPAISPAVIMALELIAADHPEMQGYLAMSAAILEREYLAAFAAIQHDRQRGKAAAERLARLELFRPGEGIPVVRMRPDAAQIDGTGRIRRANIDQFRTIFRHRALHTGIRGMVPDCSSP